MSAGFVSMIYSGTTPKFQDDLNRLPDAVRRSALELWQEWQALTAISNKTASPAEIARRDEMFAHLSKRMQLQLVNDSNCLYRCRLADGHRALGRRFVDSSGKQRIVFFAACTHKTYDRLIKDQGALERRAGMEALCLHQEAHQAWRKKRRSQMQATLVKFMRDVWPRPQQPKRPRQAARWLLSPN